MQRTIGWLERPTAKVGLDNLGAQQPCIAVYTRLLPGITNVTDRAAYFGFYPWFIRTFEARHPQATDREFRDRLRLADCLVTSVAERHAIVLDEDVSAHSATCPGRQKLGPAVRELADGDVIDLAAFADRTEGNQKRYFKNSLGGLGQYYLGPLRDEHRILQGDVERSVSYALDRGAQLADRYGHGLDPTPFFAVLEQGTASNSDLDGLAAFCPCNLKAPVRAAARNALVELFLKDGSASGVARATTVGLLLDFLNELGGAETANTVKAFLATCYGGSLPGRRWSLGEKRDGARRGWAVYARNEMLSLAWSTLFKNALDVLEGEPKPFANVDGLVDWMLSVEAFAYRPALGFDALVATDARFAPPIERYDDDDHEVAFWRSLVGTGQPSVELACRLLVRLVSRTTHDEDDQYRDVGLPSRSFSDYPMTLNSLAASSRTTWKHLGPREWMKALVREVLVAHQRIAIRKMGQSGEDTLMFRAGDLGYFVHRGLERIVETQPRLRQALQILRDLDLTITEPGRLPRLTGLGRNLLSEMPT